MLDKNYVLGWESVQYDLYEENGYVFGIELDLFNGHQSYYCEKIKKLSYSDSVQIEYFKYLDDDIYKAIDEFNEVIKK